MIWLFYAIIGTVSLLITASAVYALYWAARNGQLREVDKGGESIFDEEEPMGEQTDFFPGEGPKNTNQNDLSDRDN